MSSIVSDTINKGIPIDAQITMFTTDFLSLCDDKDKAIKELISNYICLFEYLFISS